MEGYTSIQTLVEELQKEVAKFETYKRELDARASEISAREHRIIDLERNTNSATEQLIRENTELRASVAALTKKLNEAGSDHIIDCYTPAAPVAPRKDVVAELVSEETKYVWEESFPASVNCVELACSQWEWQTRSMTRVDETTWRLEAVLDRTSPVMFKFVVDGFWQCSDNYDVCPDSEGVYNNCLPHKI